MSKHILPSNFESSAFGLPNSSGVYVVCIRPYNLISPERIMYVGSSKNMRKRVYRESHPYMKLFRRFENHLVYVKFLITDNYLELEKNIIRQTKPFLNIQHNRR